MEVPFPERIETVLAQLRWLTIGKRNAVFIPYYMPNVKMAGVFSEAYTHRGLFIFNKEKVSEEEIQKAVEEDRVGDILGYGIPRKPQNPVGAVTIRDKKNIEKQSVIVDEESLFHVLKLSQELADEGDYIDIEDVNLTALERVNYWKSVLEKELICQSV